MMTNLLFSQTTALGKTLGKRLAMVLTMLLVVGIGQAWGETIVSWSGAERTADTEYDPTTSQTDNSTAKLKSECTLSTAGTGGSAGSYYGTWTNGKCIYVTGLNLSNYKDISLTVYLRRRNPTCTASFYTSTDGSTYAATALTTKTLTNTLTSYTVTGIQSNVKSIKILITEGSGNLWLGTLSFEGTKATATPIDVTLHYKGTSTTISNQTSPYTLPTAGDYVADACDGWEFAGWYGSEYAKSETEPTFLSQLTSSGDAYAVYSHTETTGGGTSTNTTTDNIFSNGTFANNIITWTLSNVVSIKQERNGSSNSAVADYTDAPRWYKGHKITITPSVDITKITVVAQSGYADELANATFTNATASYSSNTVTITPENGRDPITIVMGAQARLSTLTVTYSGGGSSSTTYYSTTPECNTEPTQLATPTGLNVTNITSTSATLSWGKVANASSYTVSVYGENDEVIAEYPGLTENTKTVSELDPETNYVFGVVAVGDGITYTNSIQAVSDVFTTSSATCTVTYNANGGIGTPPSDATEYTKGDLVTVLGNYGKLTKDGYAFTGWNTEANGTGTPYETGETFKISANTHLYAQWCKAHWALVTSTSEIENDTRIVIAAKDEAVALSIEQKSNNRGQAEITKKYNTITFGADVQILNLLDATENKYWLSDVDEPTIGYLYAAGSNSNYYLKTGVDQSGNGNDKWEFAFNNDIAYVHASGTNTNNQLKYNSASDLFSCYGTTNSQKEVVIYKEVCVQDQYNVASTLTNATAVNTNPTTVASNATSLTLNYSANTGYLLPETITVKMGGALLVATTNYTWDKTTGTLAINVDGFFGDIDVKIVAEVDPCYGFAMSEVTATSTTPNSITLTWTEVTGATGYNVKLGTGEFTAATGLTHTFEGLTPKTTYNWEVQAVKGTCQASQTGSIATQKERFTVSWIVNGNTESPYATESVVDGNSITQYPSGPSAPSGCNKKVFVGWTNTPINTPTDKAPAILYKQKSDVPAITGNTTLHAVWADEEGSGSVGLTSTVAVGDQVVIVKIDNGTTELTGFRPDKTITDNNNYGTYAAYDGTPSSSLVWTVEEGSTASTFAFKNGNYYLNLGLNDNNLSCSNTKNQNSSWTINESDNRAVVTNAAYSSRKIMWNQSSPRFACYNKSHGLNNEQYFYHIAFYRLNGGTTHSAYTTLCDECTPSTLTLEADKTTADLDINGEATITFSTTGGNGGEITYAANPETGVTWENGTATFKKAGEYSITASQGKNGENCPTTSNTVNVTITAIPHLYFVTEPANPIEFEAVECGGNTALANKKSVELQGYNLTGNVTATVTGAYKIARTSSATLGDYSTSLTLDKTDAGKINGNYDIVYILSCPPAGGTASTVGELTFTTEAGNTLTVNLSTPTVTCTPRTLTFNDRGNTTTQEYYAGAEVPQPEDPTGVCTIPVNYVFDGWTEAEVTDGSTSYTKVNFPYSMPAANTTLYAVYRYAAGETTPTDDFVSCDINSDGIKSGGEFIITANTDNSYDEYAFNSTINSDGKGSTTPLELTPIDENGDEEDDYYQITTNDNNIIWILEGDIENGYTVKNKQTGTYWNVSGSKLQMDNTSTEKFKFYHPESNKLPIYIYNATSSKYVAAYGTSPVQYNLYNSNTHDIYLYSRKLITSYLYTTSPDCGGIAITYDFAGGDGGHCTDTRVEGGSDYTICEDVPTKTGYTFLHWSDGVNTYNPSDVIVNVTADITLTAIWQINTYTVTWSNNGVTTPVTYEHGDDLTLPSTPASCDGVKKFVGWTEQSGYYHATTPPSDLFTEKTATVTADATYYAVFATKGEGSANFVLGESGTFKMYANVNGTNYYAQGGVSSSKITSTTEAANASDYTLTHKGSNQYTIQLGNAYIGHSGTSSTDLNTTETTWTIQEGVNGSWRIVSPVNTSRALAYRASTYKIFKAYSMTNVEAGDTEYYDIEFGGTSSGYSDYTTTCQQIESIEVQEPQTDFYLTDDFRIGSGKVIATLSGGGTTDVTALATFSGYNMNVVGTYTVTVTYMGATATYEINVNPLNNAWVLTWNVSGKTNTGLGPRYVTKGSAIGTLPTPEVPAACAGKTFMGWTESNIVPSDGVGIVYITPETVPNDNTTYYAVFATVNNFCTQKPIDQIAPGSKVVIVAVASLDAGGTTGKAISSRTSDDGNNLAGDEVSIYDKTINTPHSTCIWTLYKDGEQYYFKQGDYFLNAVDEEGYTNLKWNETKELWNITSVPTYLNTYYMESTHVPDTYIEWYIRKLCFKTYYDIKNENGEFDMQFFVTANANGGADITDYTTGCEEYTITYYGFRGGYSTSTSSDGIIVLPVNSLHTVPNCGNVVTDHTNLGRTFTGVWMTKPHGGQTFKPGDTFILTQDTTLYAQWKMETTSDVTTLPTDIEDLAGTDIYVYGGKTLNIQPGTTTINSLTLKGGLQADGSYKMPTVWVPEGATLVRNSNKIYLDLVVNAKNYYPFAVPFATKNNEYVEYLDPVLAAASTYGTHFAIKTYNGARRAEVGEDKTNNWVRVLRDETLQPGVGYIITALTYPNKDTATIRIPMTVPNTWFQNGEQAEVGTTVRNTIAVTAHAGAAATEHQRHAGWNFVANPYLTSFTGGNVVNDDGLAYINGELIIEGSYEYTDEDVPYVTVPAYDFAYYSQHKLSDVKLSPEWSFFVQVGTGGTMNFTTAGRQQAPAHLAARATEQPIKMDVDITLSDDNHSDQTGLIICDRFSDAYEIGHDLEKLFGSAYNLSVYTLMADNTPLAFQALAIQNSMQVIPVGYRTPAQGEYTFALNEATSDIELLNEQYEQLILVDYETGALTNMLNNEYTFYSDRTQSNNRFALYAVPRQNTTTDLPNTIGNEEVKKVIYNDHFYILRDGKVFNGAGQIVK